MGTLLKWLFGLIIVLALLIVAAVVVLPMVVDPNDYKPQILAAAKDKLGRDLAIDEDLSLSVFPWLGIETGGVRVGNAAGFKAEWFAEVDRLGLKVKLMPLLSRQVDVDNVLVKGLRLNLEKDAKGKTNWEDLAAQQDEPAPPDAAEPAGLEGEIGVGAGALDPFQHADRDEPRLGGSPVPARAGFAPRASAVAPLSFCLEHGLPESRLHRTDAHRRRWVGHAGSRARRARVDLFLSLAEGRCADGWR